MVGLLALAIEPDVAEALGLSDDQLEQLERLCDRRESRGLPMAMKMTGVPREERVQRFAEFRAESEKLAFKLLDPTQRKKLEALRSKSDDAALAPAGIPTGNEPASARDPITEPGGEPSPAQESARDAAPAPAPLEEEALPAAVVPPSEPGIDPDDDSLTFNFRQQPWKEVLDWFADRAGLSVVVDTAPPGTLSYRDNRRHTPAEALDVLNGVLLTKGYTLVRKDRMLLVINLENDVIPPNVVTDVPLERLDERGEYELVRVLLPLDRASPDRAAEALQRLVGPQGAIVVLPEARLVQVTETAGRIRLMRSVIDAMEKNAAPVEALGEDARLKSYSLSGADAEASLAVLQTLLADSETARLAVDAQTGRLIALATDQEHLAIEATLAELRQDGRRVERIEVEVIDPFEAATIAVRLFNPTTGSGDETKSDPNAPVIEPDRIGGALLVRGNTTQIEQVRSLVEQIDAAAAYDDQQSGGTIRTLPLAGAEALATLEQIEMLWPALRDNPLEITGRGGAIPAYRPGASVDRERAGDRWGDDSFDEAKAQPKEPPPNEPTTGTRSESPFRLVGDTLVGETLGGRAPRVLVTPGPGGTVITSRDPEALDLLEQLVDTLSRGGAGGRQYAVFYLKYADAAIATTLLEAVFGGDSGSDSLMGDLAGAAIGGAGGDLVGDLLGMGSGAAGGGFDSVSVDIVPDLRLNALLVKASPQDLETVYQLLKVIDQRDGPDRVEAAGSPRTIPVRHANVDEVAVVVRQVFADRLGSGGGAASQPSPEDLIRLLRDGGDGGKKQEPDKMTIGVDQRSSSLIVRSSEPLFREVEALVALLDRDGVERPVATRVVSLRNTSSAAMRETLQSLLGDKAQTGSATPSQTTAQAKAPAAAPSSNAEQQQRQAREMMQRIEGFRRMQQMLERGGRGGRGGQGARGGRGGGRGGARGGGRGGR